VELVFYTRDTDEWMALLSDIFADAVKPQWQKPSGRDRKWTKKFGGIRPNQTLFMREFKDYAVLAMVWPWNDNILSTLKIPLVQTVQKKEEKSNHDL
jgi:hypothetical protein